MSEEDVKDDDYLVQVKAQVMTLDDSIGGWVPMGGGGMSIVGLRKLLMPNNSDTRHEYLIHGQRIADQTVVLNCVLQKDVQYTIANPTFHHWKTEEKKFGLTFQSSAEGRAFDKGIKRAVDDLREGTTPGCEAGDDEGVFMTIDLPLGRKDDSSQSDSTVSTTTSSPTPQSPALSDPFPHPNFCRIHYIHQPRPYNQQTSPPSSKSSTKSSSDSSKAEDLWQQTEKPAPNKGEETEIKSSDDSYVQFAKKSSVHEYTYPTLDSQRDLNVKKQISHQEIVSQPPLLPEKKKRNRLKSKKKQSSHLLKHQRSRCVHCNEMFIREDNHRGSCEEAPDRVAKCIQKVSCVCCARGMLYHCMADADGDYGHPCVCDTSDHSNFKKWTALTILSLFVPCLWCYWPLTACHRCGMACGCCGGRHQATLNP